MAVGTPPSSRRCGTDCNWPPRAADILDIGGESTRPDAEPVLVEEELRRTLEVVRRLAALVDIPLSIDTSKAEVARQALAAGAEIINDVTGLEGDPLMPQVALQSQAGLCVMHMRGNPRTMQGLAKYDDVVKDVVGYLQRRRDELIALGIDAARICLDPGIGFGKTTEHNVQLLRHCSSLLALGAPVLIGHSRKGFLGKLIGDQRADRLPAGLAVSLAVCAAGRACPSRP